MKNIKKLLILTKINKKIKGVIMKKRFSLW